MVELTTYQFEAGTELVRCGDPADHALLVTAGRAAVTPNGCATTEVVGPGGTIGELAAVLGTNHDVSASAIDAVTAVVIPRDVLVAAALASGGTARALARGFITELAPALRSVVLAVAGPAAPAATLVWHRIVLTAAHPAVANQLPPSGLSINRLPFRIGRSSVRHERTGRATSVELVLHDTEPYKLSRQHFVIETSQTGPVVRDDNSALGTIVNGRRIGTGRAALEAVLRAGRNTILAGTESSPFRFFLTVEAASA